MESQQKMGIGVRRTKVRPGPVLRLLAALALAAVPMLPAQAAVLPYESTVSPLQLVTATHLTTAPATDRDGNFYWGQPDNGLVMRMAPDGEQQPWATLPGIRGHAVLSDGRHVLLAPGAVIETNGRGRVIRTVRESQPPVSPDSAVDDARLGYYFTDRGTLDPTEIEARGSVWHMDRFHSAHLAAVGLHLPTGIAVGAGGTRLYVLESLRGRVLSYPIADSGELGAPRVFATLPGVGSVTADAGAATGLTVDSEGNLWIGRFGPGDVVVLDPTGALLRRYPAGMRYVTGVAFGGPRDDQLFLTGAAESPDGAGAVQRFDLGLPGIGRPLWVQ